MATTLTIKPHRGPIPPDEENLPSNWTLMCAVDASRSTADKELTEEELDNVDDLTSGRCVWTNRYIDTIRIEQRMIIGEWYYARRLAHRIKCALVFAAERTGAVPVERVRRAIEVYMGKEEKLRRADGEAWYTEVTGLIARGSTVLPALRPEPAINEYPADMVT
jgi:hypothetical protein